MMPNNKNNSNNNNIDNTDTEETTIQSHYETHSAESYDSAFFYEQGPYTKYLCDLVVQRLGLHQQKSKSNTLLDVGGGTGTFTRMLVEQSSSSEMLIHAIVVDPFLEESSKIISNNNHDDVLRFVKASAEAFLTPTIEAADQWWRQGYRHILMKEVVHHFKAADRPAIFKGMRNGLVIVDDTTTNDNDNDIPCLLIVTRPQRDIDYPLWDKARNVWAEHQPSVDELVEDLQAAGFSKVEHSIEAYPCAISFQRWQSMVRRRFWSTFAHFSNDELEAACKTMQETEKGRVDDKGNIHFEDRLVFIVAYR